MNKTLIMLAFSAFAVFGQLTTTQTTLAVALANTPTAQFCLASATGVVLPTQSQSGSLLMVDREVAQVTGTGYSATCFAVKRGVQGTAVRSHAVSSAVWVGAPASNSGDPSRPFSGGVFISRLPTGSCVRAQQYTLPYVYVGPAEAGAFTGTIVDCQGGQWGGAANGIYYVAPTQCTFAPTTLTTTNTYTTVGASQTFVLNGTSNAAAGTNTLRCNILPPSTALAFQGAVITDIVTMAGSQTTAPTSIGTATLESITFPTPAASETASTVTPVTLLGGAVTAIVPTQITTVTTAGAFLTFRHTFATPVSLSTDLQMPVFSVPFVQGAAAAMTVNTPGLFVHYRRPISLPN